MILYRDQKIRNAVAYLASGFCQRRGYYPHQTWIYKYLALLDFGLLLKQGTPCLGLNHVAMEMGPVTSELYDIRGCLRNDLFEFEETRNGGWRVRVLGTPDLDVFSDEELDEMDSILDEYAAEGFKLEDLITVVHEKIRSWQVAWGQAQQLGRGRMLMEFADEFGDALNKPEEKLNPVESRFLCYRDMVEAEEKAEALA